MIALNVTGLEISASRSGARIIDGVDLSVNAGEILGVVGESGSGKTTLGLALLNYCKPGTEVSTGEIIVGDADLSALDWRQVRELRGRKVAYVPQSPASALNPALRIGTQLRECLGGSPEENERRVREVLREVALPDDDRFVARYPHQLSGGQQQRIAIAMAFISRPALIVLDEPTTGLDVSTQEHVLETVRELCREYDCAAVYISHDMGVVAELADSIAVMYSGRVVESGTITQVFENPSHPYTARLLMAVPDLSAKRAMLGIPGNAPSPLARPVGCSFAPRCPLALPACHEQAPEAREVSPGHSIRCVHDSLDMAALIGKRASMVTMPAGDEAPLLGIEGLKAGYKSVTVLQDISINVASGQCLALLGESGSGKTTLSRCVAGLHHDFTGNVTLNGNRLANDSFKRSREDRQRVQYIFQNPYESLNPRRTVRELILQPLTALHGKVKDPDRVVTDALESVSLRADHAARYPDQLSGGERQRVAIARALATNPEVIICDEITSALDVSVQASLVELLKELQVTKGLTLLFITHNIALVRNIAQQVAILQEGRIVEYGPVEGVFENPQHSYTRSLMSATPSFELADILENHEEVA